MRLATALAAVTLVIVALSVRSSAQPGPPSSFVPGEILVKFRPGAPASAQAEAHRLGGGASLAEIARTGVHRTAVAAGSESAAIARYQRNPNVLYAEPNFIRSIPRPISHPSGSEIVPGDYYFDEQWALHNTGQLFYCIPFLGEELCLYVGTPDADIDAPEAWAISMGSASVKVAVIDSGMDYTHPDLAGKYLGGADFIFNDNDPMDDHGHGTHVAGTIAAAMNNLTGNPAEEEGVVGVAPNARILAYKVCRSDGTCDDFAIQQAIARAVTDGAQVINMSLGDSAYSQSLDDAVQDAWNAGLVIVAGAGNDGTTAPFYPAALDNVIAVTAFDEDHRRPAFSNYGPWVDISAPGNVVMSSYPLASCTGSSTPGDTGCYTWNSGTSMASPHVAGAAALVWSRPDAGNNSRVVDILLGSADRQGVDVVRLDSWTRHGGLNLHNAVTYTPNDDLVIDFGPGVGLWKAGTGWQQLHGLSPQTMVTGDLNGNGLDDLVVNFGPGIGVYAWMDHANWQALHAANPSLMVIGDFDNTGKDDIVFDFPGFGLWRFGNNATWTPLHSLDATHLAVGDLDNGNGDELLVAFPGFGLFLYDDSTGWTQLHANAIVKLLSADLDGNGRDDVVVEFAGGMGLWAFMNQATWIQVHAFSPTHVTAGDLDGNGRADLAIDFGPGIGIYLLRNGTSWTPLHPFTSEGLLLADRDGNGIEEVLIDFGPALGLWAYVNDSTWQLVHALSPELMTSGRFH